MILYSIMAVVSGALVALGGLAMLGGRSPQLPPKPASANRKVRDAKCHPWELNTAHANYRKKEDS